MLWALLTDFRRWGCMRTVTALDSRFVERVPALNRHTLPADEVACAPAGSHRETFTSLLKRCDAVLVIAPETGGILAGLTAQAERAGVPVLGSSASAVRIAGNKAACHQLFREAGLPAPPSRTCRDCLEARVAEQLGYPLVLKPVDGAGCEGICRVDRPSELGSAVAKMRRSGAKVLLQPFISGIDVSVSLLAAGDRRLPLCLNRQIIRAGAKFRYMGSQVPFDHRQAAACVDLACSAAGLIPGLSGYIGVDLILTEDSPQLIEINPRLTTSYIGMRQVMAINLAKAITDACLKGILPDRVPISGQATVIKDDPGSWGLAHAEARRRGEGK